MKKTILIVALLIFSFNVFSQPAIQWQKCLGGTLQDVAEEVLQTSEGGYIVVGASKSNNGDVTGHHGPDSLTDYWAVKLNSSGVIQWQKSLGGTLDDLANSVHQTSDGGYIVAGYSYSNDGDVSGNHGNFDYWILKLDSGGNIQWQKSMGGTDMDVAYSVCQTNDGGYIIGGFTYSNNGDVSGNHGGSDYWIVKLNNGGIIQWQKCLGGTGTDGAHEVLQASDGGFVVAGTTNSINGDVSGNHGNTDYWIVKVDTGGILQWQKCFGGTGDDGANSIQQTSDGGYIVAGGAYSNDGDVSGNHGSGDYWMVKLDGNGTLQWQKCFGGTGGESAYSTRQTSDGGYIVAGSSAGSNNGDVTGNHGSSDYWVVKLDSSGILQWQKCLGGTSSDIAYSIHQTTDDGFILTGKIVSSDGDVSGNHGNFDYWIVKLAPYVGIEENGFPPQINIFPNPVTEELRIENADLPARRAGLKIEEVEIYNSMGQRVFSQQPVASNQQLIINVSALPDGIYFVKMQSKEGIMSAKFVKE